MDAIPEQLATIGGGAVDTEQDEEEACDHPVNVEDERVAREEPDTAGSSQAEEGGAV